MSDEHGRLREVVALFLRIGTTSFGGPAAHIAITRHEVVERKQWMDDEEYARLIGLANLVPGPNSTEVAMHVGRVRAGWRGLIGAGLAFILPAFLIVLGLAWLYVEYGTRPTVERVLAGISAVVVVLIVQAIVQLSRSSLRTITTIAIAAVALLAAFLSVHELAILVLLAQGRSYAEIAQHLSLGVRTVESSLRRLYGRYGVTNRVALVRLAHLQGWIDQAR